MPSDRPNIVFILIDDMGWTDLGCFGSSFYETPRIDALRERGMAFTDGYAACPVCSPTRASVLTGQYPARVGITNFIAGNAWGRLMGVPYFKQLPAHHTTFASMLKDAGYATWHVGKWHVGEKLRPTDFGFDVNVAGNGWGMPMNGFFSPWGNSELDEEPDGYHLTDKLTDESVKLIERHDPADGPFCLHLCHYAVHTPIEAPEPLVEKYRRKAADLGLDKVDAIEQGEPIEALHKKGLHVQRRRIQSDPAYAAMVEHLDTNVGRVLDALEAAGQADNTLVIFTSDNGGLSTQEGSPTCNAPLKEGKGWVEEGGNRVPLIAAWPGHIVPGSSTAEPVTSTDFFPTFLEAAGLPLRPDLHCDGQSLVPLMEGRGEPDRPAIFWHYPHYSNQGGTPACALRTRTHKFIRWFEGDRLALYDLQNDPGELHDLIDDEPVLAGELNQMLNDWMRSIEAVIPLPNPDFDAMWDGDTEAPNEIGRWPDGSDALAGVYPGIPGGDH